MPVEALADAVLNEADPNVAGALRWALAQSGDGGLADLAKGLDAPEAEVRKRAVQSIAEIPSGAANTLLQDALTTSDVVVRRCAAVALGMRGVAAAVSTLIYMIVDDANHADAADALSTVASDPELAEQIAARHIDCLIAGTVAASDRLRLT